MILSLLLVLLGYLMGSVCSAVIVCRLFSLPDPRTEGSKNPGATNVLRIAGKQYAIIVLIADLLKGLIPVLIAKACGADPATIAFTALAAVLGHMFPVFFNFQGGKGVATAIGALLGFYFMVGILVAATWLLVAKFSRYSSLASIISMTLAPFYSLLVIGELDSFPPLFILAIFILFKHKQNISRLVDGTEPKIKLKTNTIEDVLIEPNEDSPQRPKSKTLSSKAKPKAKAKPEAPAKKSNKAASPKNKKTTPKKASTSTK